MGLLSKAVSSKVMDLSAIEQSADYAGWHKIGGSGTYSAWKSNDYENAYPSINRISNAHMMIEPYTIDGNGKPVASNVLDRVYTPNTEMSAADFREALVVMSMVHPKVNLRVHYKGSKITEKSITGFTFIEGAFSLVRDGKHVFQLPNGESVTSDEVITLKSINPYDLQEGFSPSQSARKWITLDDYIACYQAGFFKNGAVPAGQFIITARTAQDFNDQVDKMEEKHRGAGRNNNVTYTHRPVDATGSPLNAQIEWVPFNQTNKELGMKDLFEQANKKIDSAFGVPASIRGVNDNNTYASVRVDEVIFTKYVVDPIIFKIWSKFTHELNRITGGTGVAFDYDLEIPQIADEEKVKAEARKTDLDTINAGIEAGFSVDAIVDAFGLPETYKKLIKSTAGQSVDKPQVASPEELRDTPEPELPNGYGRKQVTARDIPSLSTLEIDPIMVADASTRGCIMLKTKSLSVLNVVENAESDLSPTEDEPVPAETSPHVTLLYGLLNNGNTWKPVVDDVLKGWSSPTVEVEEVGFFTLPGSYAIVAHIKKTTELIDANQRLTLLPNAPTFSEYKPHMTLAYIKKDADLGKWIKALGEKYNGIKLETDGLDYGHPPKESKSLLKKKEVTPQIRNEYETQVRMIAREQRSKQINSAIDGLDSSSKAIDATEEETEAFADALALALIPFIVLAGIDQTELGAALVLESGLATETIRDFSLTDEQIKLYNNYIQRVGTSYTTTVAEEIRAVLARSAEQELTQAQIKTQLRELLSEEYQIRRLAVTEVGKAGNLGSVNAMKNIQADTGYTVEKVWTLSGRSDHCPYCEALSGRVVSLAEAFVNSGDDIIGTDGSTFTNNWVDMETCNAHPNCTCTQTYRVRR